MLVFKGSRMGSIVLVIIVLLNGAECHVFLMKRW
jgi:hypothetical protein